MLLFSLPAGVVAAVITFATYEVVRRLDSVSLDQARSCATMTLLGIGLVILVLISRPLRAWKLGLATSMAAGYGVTMAWPPLRSFFQLTLPPRAPGCW